MVNPHPLLEKMRALCEDRKSGVLALSRGTDSVDVFYREGMIQAVSSNLESLHLGDYLLKQGYLTTRTFHSILTTVRKKGVSFGELSVQRNFLAPSELARMVKCQAIDILQHVLKTDFSVQSFSGAAPSFYAPCNLNFASLLVELSRSGFTPVECEPDAWMRLAFKDLPEVDWFPEELHVLSQLVHPTTVNRMLAATGFQENGLRRILGVFDRLGIIEFIDGGRELDQNDEGLTTVSHMSDAPFGGLVSVVSNMVLAEPVEIINKSSTYINEQFKSLKIRINASDNPPKVITISSAEQQEGKSLISVNLALSYAKETGRRVFIMDCDLRRPSLNAYLGVSNDAGVVQFLSEDRLAAHCYVRRLGNLYFMTSGGIAENPVELLSSRKMRTFIDSLKTQFDTIILDAPPFAPVADPRIVAALSDGFIMVVRRGQTSYRVLQNVARVIDRQKLLGAVFNDVKPQFFNRYYGRSYYTYGNASSPSIRGKSRPRSYLTS